MSVDVRNRLDVRKRKGSKEHQVRNVSTRCKGVGVFGSALLRCELARDGARGFGSSIGCSGVILVTWDGRRQVGIGQIEGMVTVVTP